MYDIDWKYILVAENKKEHILRCLSSLYFLGVENFTYKIGWLKPGGYKVSRGKALLTPHKFVHINELNHIDLIESIGAFTSYEIDKKVLPIDDIISKAKRRIHIIADSNFLKYTVPRRHVRPLYEEDDSKLINSLKIIENTRSLLKSHGITLPNITDNIYIDLLAWTHSNFFDIRYNNIVDFFSELLNNPLTSLNIWNQLEKIEEYFFEISPTDNLVIRWFRRQLTISESETRSILKKLYDHIFRPTGEHRYLIDKNIPNKKDIRRLKKETKLLNDIFDTIDEKYATMLKKWLINGDSKYGY